MPIHTDVIEAKLLAVFPDAIIDLQDLVGDQNHYKLVISSTKFNNISKLAQHKLVNNALKELLASELHALQIITLGK